MCDLLLNDLVRMTYLLIRMITAATASAAIVSIMAALELVLELLDASHHSDQARGRRFFGFGALTQARLDNG